MILQRLCEMYERLLDSPDPETGLPRVSPYGFSEENISHCLVLTTLGNLVDVVDMRDKSGKKAKARRLSVPQSFKRPGTAPKSFFLWDKSAYVLGIEGNKNNSEAKKVPWVIAERSHASFKKLHEKLLADQSDEGLIALRNFLSNWNPKNFSQPPFSTDQVDTNLVFKLDGDLTYIHERPAAIRLWMSTLRPTEEIEANIREKKEICLVTGKESPISRVHPNIKGVSNGQSTGVSIVSFNAEAYESYGKLQGSNAPISEQSAFAYTTALNYMLRRDKGHSLIVGNTSTVFWARAKTDSAEEQAVTFFSTFINPPDDDSQRKKVQFSLIKIGKGLPVEEIAPNLDPSTRFYVLGVAPNAARLSIRYWFDSTLGELTKHIAEHWQDMQLEPPPWKNEYPPSLKQLLSETAPLRNPDHISSKLIGEFLRSILTGQHYPRALLTQIVQRIRADGILNGIRIAIIKSVLSRDFRKGFSKEAIPMSLDLNNSPLAYRLGCLFAVLERAQSEAVPSANATIVDRYFSTASSVPYSVFPRLIAGCQNHISKIRKNKPDIAIILSKKIGEIVDTLPSSFPKHLSIDQQGQFAVGFYHQRHSLFTKKNSEAEAATLTESN